MDGIKIALPSVTKILEERNDTVYLIAGDGEFFVPLKEYLENNFSTFFNSKIFLLGYVSDVENLFATSDIVVYFSLQDGYPQVVLEAQAAKKPIIVNKADWSSEMIENGKTGFIVDTEEKNELYSKIKLLLDSPTLRNSIGKSGYEKISRENNYSYVGECLISALKEILDDVQ